MKKKIIAALLTSTLLISSCSTTATESIVSEETTTTTTIETTIETTTETTTEETTEATTTVTFPEDGLQMTIEEVAQTIVDAMGNEYYIYSSDVEKEYWERVVNYNRSLGIVNFMTCGINYMSPEDEFVYEDYNSVAVIFNIFEFDMQLEEYASLCETYEFYQIFDDKNEPYPVSALAINKQYVITVYAQYAKLDKNGVYKSTSDVPQETQPPFTIGNTQAGYEAFLALE